MDHLLICQDTNCQKVERCAAIEVHVMQAIHGNRTIYNVRNGWDIARFLADAVKEDVEGHLGNLKCAPIGS